MPSSHIKSMSAERSHLYLQSTCTPARSRAGSVAGFSVSGFATASKAQSATSTAARPMSAGSAATYSYNGAVDVKMTPTPTAMHTPSRLRTQTLVQAQAGSS